MFDVYCIFQWSNANQYYPCLQISSVVLDEGGELLQATDPNSDDSMLRIEFVGDSITAGFKVSASSVSEPSTTANQDVHLAYPRHLADLFETEDFLVIARSGVSVVAVDATGVPMPLEVSPSLCSSFRWMIHSCIFRYSPFSIHVRNIIGNGKGRVRLYMTSPRGKPTLSLLT